MANAEKTAAVAEITDAFRGTSAAVLTEYRGLTVAQLKQLRRAIASDATYTVVKNTLTKIAMQQAGMPDVADRLTGPTAIAFVTGDPVNVAKGIRDFARTNPLLVVKGGVLEGKTLSADEVRRLADLESREVLLARLAGAMQGSLAKAAGLFAAPLSQVARLAAALEQKAQEDPSVLRGAAGTPADAPIPVPDADAAPPGAGATHAAPPGAVATDDPSAAAATDADSEMPSDGTPGVEDSPEISPAAVGDAGAEAQAVADAVDIVPDTDVAGGATSAS
jgi:large subunit ribosomal protein L10